MLAMQLETSIN